MGQNDDMGEVHSLIIKHGIEMARSMAATKAERNAIEAAASIMGEEESRMGINPRRIRND